MRAQSVGVVANMWTGRIDRRPTQARTHYTSLFTIWDTSFIHSIHETDPTTSTRSSGYREVSQLRIVVADQPCGRLTPLPRPSCPTPTNTHTRSSYRLYSFLERAPNVMIAPLINCRMPGPSVAPATVINRSLLSHICTQPDRLSFCQSEYDEVSVCFCQIEPTCVLHYGFASRQQFACCIVDRRLQAQLAACSGRSSTPSSCTSSRSPILSLAFSQ